LVCPKIEIIRKIHIPPHSSDNFLKTKIKLNKEIFEVINKVRSGWEGPIVNQSFHQAPQNEDLTGRG
jgi:hypothetical protein